MKKVKKIGGFLFSMKFALIILVIFVVVCIAGSVIPQGEIEAVYQTAYPGWSGMILALGLDDVFHAPWFVTLTLILCLNLLGCNVLRFPKLMHRTRQTKHHLPKGYKDLSGKKTGTVVKSAAEGKNSWEEPDRGRFLLNGTPEPLLKEMGFTGTKEYTEDGITYRYGIRNRIGLWGAWLTHLGLLIIILGFSLGQVFTVKYTIYGVPDTESPIGDTGYSLRIDDFNVSLREDDTVEQYTASLTVTDTYTEESWSGESSVNHPWKAAGMKLYQNSMGWAAEMAIYRGETLLQTELVYAGDFVEVQDKKDLMILFRAFYPDYVRGADGMPATASDRLNNPAYLYAVYYQGEMLGMNVLAADERITISDYSVVFHDPQYYTLIQVKDDPFTWLALVGGLVLLVALFIAFYLRTEEIWLIPVEEEDRVSASDEENLKNSLGEAGEQNASHGRTGQNDAAAEHWQVLGYSRKGSILYQDKLEEAVKTINAGGSAR